MGLQAEPRGSSCSWAHVCSCSPPLLGATAAEFEPCISISQAPKLSFRSQRYFFIYFKGLWCTLLDGCLDLLFNELPRICRVSQLKASQLIQRECRCLRFSQRTNFPFYRFLSFPHCRGEGNISPLLLWETIKNPLSLQNCWIQKILG